MIPEARDVDVEELSGDELASALETAASDASWEYRAAVGLIVEQGSWLRRYEFRQAVDAWVDHEGRLMAWVDWAEVDVEAPASSGESPILEIACSLGGIATTRSLRDLLSSFDEHNTERVLRAFQISLRGWAS